MIISVDFVIRMFHLKNIPMLLIFLVLISFDDSSSSNETITPLLPVCSSKVTIPSEFYTIPDKAFAFCQIMLTAVIPGTITSIGTQSFYYCTSLTSVFIPSSVISIGSKAFEYCSDLRGITFGSSLTYIGSYAFSYCTEVVSLTIPESVKVIDVSAFSYMSAMATLTILSTNIAMERKAFYAETSLQCVTASVNVSALVLSLCGVTCPFATFCPFSPTTAPTTAVPSNIPTVTPTYFPTASPTAGCQAHLIIPNGYTIIPDSAFAFCTTLVTLVIPKTVTSIGKNGFYYCTDLQGVTIPDSVVTIGDKAFEYATALKQLVIGSSVTYIGSHAFSYASKLLTISIPDSVQLIESSAFAYCASVVSITVHSSSVYLGAKSFYGEVSARCLAASPNVSAAIIAMCGDTCPFLQICSFAPTLAPTTQPPSLSPSTAPSTMPSAAPTAGCQTHLIIPNGYVRIPANAFSFCTDMLTLVIPNTVTSIENNGFYYCTSLREIDIPNSVVSIGDKAFEYASSALQLTIGSSVTYIGVKAFAYATKLISLTVPASMRVIQASAFAYCSSARNITIRSSTLSLASRSFYGETEVQCIISDDFSIAQAVLSECGNTCPFARYCVVPDTPTRSPTASPSRAPTTLSTRRPTSSATLSPSPSPTFTPQPTIPTGLPAAKTSSPSEKRPPTCNPTLHSAQGSIGAADSSSNDALSTPAIVGIVIGALVTAAVMWWISVRYNMCPSPWSLSRGRFDGLFLYRNNGDSAALRLSDDFLDTSTSEDFGYQDAYPRSSSRGVEVRSGETAGGGDRGESDEDSIYFSPVHSQYRRGNR